MIKMKFLMVSLKVFLNQIYKLGTIKADSSIIHPEPRNPKRLFENSVYLESIIVSSVPDYDKNIENSHLSEAAYSSLADHFKLISKYQIILISHKLEII